jgi:hypothetical protein
LRAAGSWGWDDRPPTGIAGHDDGEYIRQRGDLLPGVLAAINMDGIGPKLGTNTIMIVSHSEGFQQEVARRVEQYPGMVWVEPWPASNHSTFAWRGVPSIAFSSIGGKPLPHTADDTVDWISAAKLAGGRWRGIVGCWRISRSAGRDRRDSPPRQQHGCLAAGRFTIRGGIGLAGKVQ